MKTLLILAALLLVPVSMPVRAQAAKWQHDPEHFRAPRPIDSCYVYLYPDSAWSTWRLYPIPHVDTVIVHDTIYVDTCKQRSVKK